MDTSDGGQFRRATRGRWALAVLMMAASMTLAACGSDDDEGGGGGGGSQQAAAQNEPCTTPKPAAPVRLALNPQNVAWLPYFIAMDKGYFKQNGIDLKLKTFAGSSATQLPLLSRGSLDLTPVGVSAGLFSGYKQGFEYKLLIANNEARDGYMSNTSLMGTPELVDSGKLDQPSGLKGLRLDAQLPGTIADLLMQRAIAESGLSKGDVRLTYRAKNPPDVLALFQKDGVDVAPSLEPIATVMEQDGLAKKWKTTSDLYPSLQDNYLAASPDFLEDNRCTAVAFTKAYLQGVRDMLASEGKWTPELSKIATKWTKLPPKVIDGIGATPYSPPDGAIDTKSLADSQEGFKRAGLVRSPVDVKEMVDTSVAAEATKGT